MNIDDEFELEEEFDLSTEFESDEELSRFRRLPPRSLISAPRPRPRPVPPRRPKFPRPVIGRRTYLYAPDSPAESEYVRWVQSMLNQALNLQLPVDGIMSVETRSAIRSLQEKNSLPVTGIVGPDTERALLAGSGQPPAPTTEFEAAEWQSEFSRPGRPKTPPPPAPTGTWLTPFISSAIPKYPDVSGKLQATDCAIYVPKVAWKQAVIDLMVFFHGDPGPCSDTFLPDPKKTTKKFSLDVQVDSSGRAIAVAVPTLRWIVGKSSNIVGKWTAAHFNQFVDEVLDQIGKQSGVKPKLGSLIIAGHSHAYAIFTPLACEFDQAAPATTKGPLANLKQVWALDSTYSQAHAHALEVWARKRPAVQFVAVLYKKGTPASQWTNYFTAEGYCPAEFKRPPNLTHCIVNDGEGTHCLIPSKYVRLLLSYSSDWCTF